MIPRPAKHLSSIYYLMIPRFQYVSELRIFSLGLLDQACELRRKYVSRHYSISENLGNVIV